ncbi:hypothetical protein NDU88_008732 [Pleurodeles waltl]|uniref:Uncharacterized protein n=1 Tax=Pleurodeles waltl TaxID=8319 RepID=A0AAV7PR87_PLEWA|nr:hypothetical protein NDU88_008732 [Pleurodeles waltl]
MGVFLFWPPTSPLSPLLPTNCPSLTSWTCARLFEEPWARRGSGQGQAGSTLVSLHDEAATWGISGTASISSELQDWSSGRKPLRSHTGVTMEQQKCNTGALEGHRKRLQETATPSRCLGSYKFPQAGQYMNSTVGRRRPVLTEAAGATPVQFVQTVLPVPLCLLPPHASQFNRDSIFHAR